MLVIDVPAICNRRLTSLFSYLVFLAAAASVPCWAQSPIIQKAQFADCMGPKAPECTEANFNPIGTGPFAVTEFKPNDVITLTANDNYREPGKPALKISVPATSAANSTSNPVSTREFPRTITLGANSAMP